MRKRFQGIGHACDDPVLSHLLLKKGSLKPAPAPSKMNSTLFFSIPKEEAGFRRSVSVELLTSADFGASMRSDERCAREFQRLLDCCNRIRRARLVIGVPKMILPDGIPNLALKLREAGHDVAYYYKSPAHKNAALRTGISADKKSALEKLAETAYKNVGEYEFIHPFRQGLEHKGVLFIEAKARLLRGLNEEGKRKLQRELRRVINSHNSIPRVVCIGFDVPEDILMLTMLTIENASQEPCAFADSLPQGKTRNRELLPALTKSTDRALDAISTRAEFQHVFAPGRRGWEQLNRPQYSEDLNGYVVQGIQFNIFVNLAQFKLELRKLTEASPPRVLLDLSSWPGQSEKADSEENPYDDRPVAAIRTEFIEGLAAKGGIGVVLTSDQNLQERLVRDLGQDATDNCVVSSEEQAWKRFSHHLHLAPPFGPYWKTISRPHLFRPKQPLCHLRARKKLFDSRGSSSMFTDELQALSKTKLKGCVLNLPADVVPPVPSFNFTTMLNMLEGATNCFRGRGRFFIVCEDQSKSREIAKSKKTLAPYLIDDADEAFAMIQFNLLERQKLWQFCKAKIAPDRMDTLIVRIPGEPHVPELFDKAEPGPLLQALKAELAEIALVRAHLVIELPSSVEAVSTEVGKVFSEVLKKIVGKGYRVAGVYNRLGSKPSVLSNLGFTSSQRFGLMSEALQGLPAEKNY